MLDVRLAQIRELRGYTKKQVGEYLNMTPEGYGHYESGKRKPNPETINALADFFETSVDYLLGRTEDPTPPDEKSPLPYDEEARELMEQMYQRDELKVLFSVSKNAKKEDIEFVNEMLKRFQREQEGE